MVDGVGFLVQVQGADRRVRRPRLSWDDHLGRLGSVMGRRGRLGVRARERRTPRVQVVQVRDWTFLSVRCRHPSVDHYVT